MPRELQLPSHPVLISSPASGLRPPREVSSAMERKGVFLSPRPWSQRRVPRGQAGREDMWTQGGGTCPQDPLCCKHGNFPGEGAPGCWRQGLAGEREAHHQTRGSRPTFPPKCSQEATALFLLPRPKCSFQSSTFYILSVLKRSVLTRSFKRKTESRWTPFLLLNPSSVVLWFYFYVFIDLFYFIFIF